MSWTQTVPKKGGEGEGKERWLPDEDGMRPAVLVGLIDLGTHREPGFNGAADEDVHKIQLCWEIVGEKDPAGGPVVLGKDYRYSLHEKANLGKLISRWRGKPLAEGEEFDLRKLLGQPCLADIKRKTARESGNQYAAISDISGWSGPMVKGREKPVPTIKPVCWTFTDGPYPGWSWVPYVYADPVHELVKTAKEAGAQRPQTPGFPPGQTPDMTDAAPADSIPF